LLIVRRSLFAALLLAIALPRSASAQRILGPGNDAWTLPGGVFRFDVSSRFLGARERFGPDGRESIAAPFAGVLDATRLPSLLNLEADIAALTQSNPFQASLGTARINAVISAAVIPLSFQFGITSRLTFRASAPFFTGVQEVQWGLDGTGATVGSNPALGNQAALTNNATIVGSLEAAAADLERLANDCAGNPGLDPRCAQVIAELNAVRALVERTRETTALLARTYGGSPGVPASPFVPVIGSTAHNAVTAQIDVLRTEFDRYFTSSVPEGASPSGAGAPATITDLQALLADSAQGYAIGPIGRRYHQGFGDVDVGVMLRLYDGIGANPWLTDTVVTRGIRQTFGFTYRLGTGKPQTADDPFLLPTGDGQDDLEFLSATDILAGRHLWGSVIVRFTKQQPIDRITRIPDASGSPFIPLDRRRMARTQLGNRIEVEALPRWIMNDYFAFGLQYRFMTQQAGSVDEIAPFTDAIPLTTSLPSMSSHEVGIGFTWSSIAAHRRNRAKLPLEISYDHTMVIAGTGGAVRFSADRISVRAYARLWGADGPPRR
jgi:hypothetical protein